MDPFRVPNRSAWQGHAVEAWGSVWLAKVILMVWACLRRKKWKGREGMCELGYWSALERFAVV